jgi:hypothetical protein
MNIPPVFLIVSVSFETRADVVILLKKMHGANVKITFNSQFPAKL